MDPYVQHLVTRKPTVPSIISRQGVKETLDRNVLALSAGAAGYALGTGLGTGDNPSFGVLADADKVPGGIKGAIAGAAIGYGVSKLGKRMGDY
jgi:hypothetical protein